MKQKGVKGNQARKYPVLILANFDLSQTYKYLICKVLLGFDDHVYMIYY